MLGAPFGRRDRLGKVRLEILGRSADNSLEHRVGVGKHGDVWRTGWGGRRAGLDARGFCDLRLGGGRLQPCFHQRALARAALAVERNICRRFIVVPFFVILNFERFALLGDRPLAGRQRNAWAYLSCTTSGS